MTSLVGQTLGQYQVIGLIGEGGMAAVYQARQTSMKRDVAIKAIKPNLVDMDDFATRFEHEAQIVASLSHAHILKVFDYGRHDDVVFIVMEMLTGGSLDQLINKGPMPLDRAGVILDQIAGALDYAHNKGIVHRDLKPENVLLDESGSAFLTDFGLAKLVNSSLKLTQSGAAIGTPAYMAPEQWRAQPLDARTDVYALGVLLYEMLTGSVPFNGDSALSMMYLHLHEPPRTAQALNPGIPLAVENVVERALAKDPADRFQSAGQMAAAYREAIATPSAASAIRPAPAKSGVKSSGTVPAAAPITKVLPAASDKSAGTPGWLIGAVVVAVLIVAGMAVLAATRLSQQNQVLPTAAALAQGSTATSAAAVQTSTPHVVITESNLLAAAKTDVATESAKPTQPPTIAPTAAPPTPVQATQVPPTAVAAAIEPQPPLPGGPQIAGAMTLVGHSAPVNSVDFSPNGKYVASASDDMTVRLWTVQTGQPARTFKGHTGPVKSVAISPKGDIVASAGTDKAVLWDLNAGTPIRTLEEASVNSIAFSPNGLFVLTGDDDSTAKIWETATGKLVRTLTGHTAAVNRATYSHNGSYILTASVDGTAIVWNPATGKAVQVLKGHNGPVQTAIFSPTDQYILTGALDGTARFWQTDGGKLLQVLDNFGSNVLAVGFAPDGHEALIGSEDGTVWGWNALTGKRSHEMTGHTSAVHDVVFGPVGLFMLATGVADNTVRLWPLPQPPAPGQGGGQGQPGPGTGPGQGKP